MRGELSGRDHWFEDLAAHLGAAYLRYSFTKGTEQEVDFLVDVIGVAPGMRVLDVGCGPGRHAHALGRRGVEVHGVDISQRFIDIASDGAPPGVTFERADARRLRFDSEFDLAMSLCQGGFGLVGAGPDGEILAGMARAVRRGGTVVVSAFSSYFQVRHLEERNRFDAATGLHHEVATIKDEAGCDADHDLWTTCYTPRELRLLAAAAGLEVRDVWSVEPGSYAARDASIDTAEYLLVAARPSGEPV